MIFFRLVLPFLYFAVTICAYGVTFNKSFIKSMAPSFFLQILAIMVTSMVANNFTMGVIICLGLSMVTCVFSLVKNRSFVKIREVCKAEYGYNEFFIFACAYLFIYIMNYGKHFTDWDEFSHWGIFIKETYRLDTLFCRSPYWMVHKDYVPAITVFETLFCKLSFRYSEADAYRGIQLLQVAMILPVLVTSEKTIDFYANTKNRVLSLVAKIVVIVGIPLYFLSPKYYHTVYQDLIFGVFIFYSLWLVFTEDNCKYKTVVLSLALSILVLSKMVAMAFLPMIVIFYFVYSILFEKRRFGKKIFSSIIALCLPILLWIICNRYIDVFVPNDGGGQSYDGLSLGKVLGIVLHDNSVTYQSTVEKTYLNAILKQGIIGNLSYSVMLLLITFVLVVFAFFLDGLSKKKVLLIDLWVLLAGIVYGCLMWILYLTSFSEYEALTLASYERYMETYLLAATFLAFGTIFYYASNKLYFVIYGSALVVLQNVVFFCDSSQLLPGKFTGDTYPYEGETRLISEMVPDSASVCIIMKGDNLTAPIALAYTCFPRTIVMVRPGKPKSDFDVWSKDYSEEEFINYIEQYDYIYFMDIDDDFIDNYSSAFSNPEGIHIGRLCKIDSQDTKIRIRWVEE